MLATPTARSELFHTTTSRAAMACERSRGAGIASTVLNGLIAEAGRSGKPVSIYLEDFNPSLRLFERLGFRIAKQDGFQLLLERAPNCNENDKSNASASDECQKA